MQNLSTEVKPDFPITRTIEEALENAQSDAAAEEASILFGPLEGDRTSKDNFACAEICDETLPSAFNADLTQNVTVDLQQKRSQLHCTAVNANTNDVADIIMAEELVLAAHPAAGFSAISSFSEISANESHLDSISDDPEPLQNVFVVNHVMSNDVKSGIFDAFIGFLAADRPETIQHITSVAPIDNADVYHYHRPNLEQKLRRSAVVTVHHDVHDSDPWHDMFRFLPRYAEAGAVVCLNSTQQEILSRHGIKNTTVIPHGFHSRLLSPKPQRQFDPTRKFTLAVISKRYGRRVKGEAYLLELLKRLDPDRIAFTFVGEERSEDCFKARSLGFTSEVFERLPYHLFNEIYHRSDALLVTSLHEGGPANLPEAIATGTPIISTPVGMTIDMVEDGLNGIILSRDPSIDAPRIMSFANNLGNLADRLYLGAQQGTSRAPTWEQVAVTYRHIYETMHVNLRK